MEIPILLDCDILLINPRYESGSLSGYNRVPAGLGYIARAVELAGFKYAVIDLNMSHDGEIFNFLKRVRPAFVGIGMMSFRVEENYALLTRIKGAFPAAVIIAGGPHVIASGGAVMAECAAVDIACAGEGEETIVELLRGAPLEDIKGIYFRRSGAVVENAGREFIADLDRLPFPVYKGFPLEKYSKTMPLASSRGCCYKCAFCGAPRLLGERWRKRSAAGMFDEFKYWRERGYRDFIFEDSLFSLDKKRVADFCDMVVESGLTAEFAADGVRADHLDRPTLEKMKAAGFNSISFGVESAADHVLESFNKGETIGRIADTIAIADDLEFAIGLFFILGGPGETPADARKSFEFALKFENVSQVYFFRLTPIPGTPYFDYAVEHGLAHKNDRYPGGNFGFETSAAYGNDRMSAAELTRLLAEARAVEAKVRDRYAVRRLLKRFAAGAGLRRGLFALYELADDLFAAGTRLRAIKRFARIIFEGRAAYSQLHSVNGSRLVSDGRKGPLLAVDEELEYAPCDLCGSFEHKIRYRKPDTWLWRDVTEYAVVECSQCGLVFVNPRPRENRMWAFYPQDYFAGRDSAEHIKRYMRQIEFLPALDREKVLDFGCARGDFLACLKKKYPNIEAVGVDPYSPSAQIAGVKLYNGELRNRGFGAGEFDLVTAWAVFEHLHRPAEYFAEVARILKPGGRFIFLVTNSESVYGRYAFREDVPRHLYHFSEKTLGGYAEKYGFEFVKCHYDDSIFDGRGFGAFENLCRRAAGISWRDFCHGRAGLAGKAALRLGALVDRLIFGPRWEAALKRSGIIIAEFKKCGRA